MASLLHIEAAGHVTVLTLNNPQSANALTDGLLEDLRQAVLDLNQDHSVRCLLLRGAGGRVFSSGYDTSQLEPHRFNALPDPIGPVCEAMLRGRLPIVGCINGHVLGGAVEIAASCDIRIAQTGATVGIPAGRFGICYAPAGIEQLCHTLGQQLALELLLTGKPIAIERPGNTFASQIFAAEEIDEVAVNMAQNIATAAPLAVESMRKIVHEAAAPGPRTNSLTQQQAMQLFQDCLKSADLKEGLEALATKRKPVFHRK